MIERIFKAIIVGVVIWLLCLFGGGLLATLPIPPIAYVGSFLAQYAYVIGAVAGLWYFAFGGFTFPSRA